MTALAGKKASKQAHHASLSAEKNLIMMREAFSSVELTSLMNVAMVSAARVCVCVFFSSFNNWAFILRARVLAKRLALFLVDGENSVH